MNIELLYGDVKNLIGALDFGKIWPGFKPLRFALYDDAKCFFDGGYVEKTDEFCANTSIVYKGEQIAIFMVQGEQDAEVLCSKIVHEMFHGYQRINGWNCWPNELQALYRYEYDAGNISMKLYENRLLLDLLGGFDNEKYKELMSLKKLRSKLYPYQFSYEACVEEIEGTANYVELQVLKQLNPEKAAMEADRMRIQLTDPLRMFPVRISCYYAGALAVNAMRLAGCYPFIAEKRPVITDVLKDPGIIGGNEKTCDVFFKEASKAVENYRNETDAIIRSAVKNGETVLKGPFELTGVNVYNARCLSGYITSTYFLMYKDTEDKMLRGNFVIKMKDENTIETVYRWV